jgi:multimeric flavodoxin WrbA
MAKNILVLAASPRKGGNSDILCDQFIKGASGNGNKIEKIYVNDLNIGTCQACYYCMEKEPGVCFIKDDMAEMLDKMMAADVIVLATPVYFYTMNGQLKTLIDRVLPKYTVMTDKEFYFIATAADDRSLLERTIDGLRDFTDCLEVAVVKGVVYGADSWKKGDIENKPAMREAYNFGLNCR